MEKANARMEAFSETDDDCPEFNKFSSVNLKFTDNLKFVGMKRKQEE